MEYFQSVYLVRSYYWVVPKKEKKTEMTETATIDKTWWKEGIEGLGTDNAIINNYATVSTNGYSVDLNLTKPSFLKWGISNE